MSDARAPDPAPARSPAALRRWLAGGAWATGAFLLLLAILLAWLLATASGAQFVLGRAVALAGGTLGTVEGRLAGPLSVDAIEVVAPGMRLRAKQVALDWSPWRLLGSEVRIERLHAASLEIATAPSKEPAREPASLAAPFRLHVERAGVDQLRMGTLGQDEGGVELRDVSLGLAAERAVWILGGARASTPVGQVKLAGTLGARAPFPLDFKGEIAGTRNAAAYRATVTAAGPLAKFVATLEGSEGGLSGKASATLEPFAAAPLRGLSAKLDGLDLSAFSAAPATRLSVVADLAPGAGAILAGPVKIANAAPATLDKGGLPVASAAAQLVIAKERIEATKLTAAFAGGGSASGDARWSGGKLDAKVAVKGVDLRAMHAALRTTRLSGDIVAVATGQAQSFDVALADPRFEIRGEARIADGMLTVGKARIARGPAFAEASGMLALSGARGFRADGRIGNFDPAAFSTLPAGDLNASFTASGSLSKGAAGEGVLEIAKSRFGGMAAEGRVALATDGARLTRADADVALGATRLQAKGALGRTGDTLEVKLASPDLSPIGRAFGRAIGGSVDLDARVAGEFASLSGEGTLEAKDLSLPGGVRVAAASGRVALGAGDDGAANGRVLVTGVTQGGERAPLIEQATATIKGTRRAHEIRVEARLPEASSAEALLDGGVVAGARAPAWRGRLESAATSGLAQFALSAPAALFVSAERIELGEALLSGEAGELRLLATRWTPQGLETRGASNAVVIRTLRRLLNLQEQMASNLVLAGEWDVRVGDSVDGHFTLRRQSGDVRLGEPRQALGLDVVAIRADASGGRIRAAAQIRGKQAGDWKGEATVMLARGAGGWEVSPAAPLEGRFTVDVPDIAWTAAWMGPEAKAGGRLVGEGTLAGTLREPTWSGRLEATKLVIREPTLGAEVADGTIVVALKDREARIERLFLSMPWQPGPEAARAIAAAKRPAAGTVTAEGSVDLGTRKGTVRVKTDAWPLTRLSTRFLAISGEGRVDLDGNTTSMNGAFVADAGWFGIPASAPPALSDDVIVDRGAEGPAAAHDAGRVRLDLRVELGEHLYFVGRGLTTRLAGALRLAGDAGANLRTTGTIRAVGGTFVAYGRTLAIERGALNFQGPIDNPGLNVLALRKGLPVEAGVEVVGTVARPKVRLVSTPDVPESEKLAWLVLGRGRGDVSAADASTLAGAASALLGEGALPTGRLLRGLGLDEVSVGADEGGVLGIMPQSTVAGRTGGSSSAEVVTVGKQITDDLRVSYRQGLADAEGSLRITLQFTKSLQFILRAGYLPGIDAAYRFSFK